MEIVSSQWSIKTPKHTISIVFESIVDCFLFMKLYKCSNFFFIQLCFNVAFCRFTFPAAGWKTVQSIYVYHLIFLNSSGLFSVHEVLHKHEYLIFLQLLFYVAFCRFTFIPRPQLVWNYCSKYICVCISFHEFTYVNLASNKLTTLDFI